MMLYRFTPEIFSNNFNGQGAKLFGGRWNSIGLATMYCSNVISLSLLELFIHSVSYEEIAKNKLISIEAPENIKEIKSTDLKNNWYLDYGYTRFIGDEFLKSSASLLLKVPSAIIQEENIFLINPQHKDFNKVKIKSINAFEFDVRLFNKP